MPVVIDQLSKVYGTQVAVDAISFEAPTGKVTGFLGPNGAGKSTTMKIATGFLSATSGDILLEGISVQSDPLSVKRITGYLPEHNPLYLDMHVKEFLRFIGRAYGISGSVLSSGVSKVIDTVGLEREKSKKIRELSKGYRQRVGLAQALIHDPKVLILDEPTSGLDPNQIIEIREVIKSISQEKTVILSTHIMQEVEAICDRVVIINKGKLVADDTLANLQHGEAKSTGVIVEFEWNVELALFENEGFTCSIYGKNAILIESERPDVRAEVLKITSENDLPLVSLTKARKSLEEIFHRLTNVA